MNKGALEGIKIAAFGWAIVGALTMKYLADHGATVIRVETGRRPDSMRSAPPFKDKKPGLNRSGYFNFYAANQYSLSLDMSHPRALEVAGKLVAWADVAQENFSPGIMEKWGLGYEDLKQIKPDIIMLRESGLGGYGPYSRQPAYGMVLAALAGLPNFLGWPGQPPLPLGVAAYTDCIAPRFALAALIAALDQRDKTGKGQLMDLSQLETAQYFTIPAMLDYVVNGREPVRAGNASPYAAPHGVFKCQGDDRWCAIAVSTDEEWRAFCHVIGRPDLTEDTRFVTMLARKENEEELDSCVEEWTIKFSPEEVMDRMQAAGVPAGVVKNAADIYEDPQLKHREYLWNLNHTEIGDFSHLGQCFRLSRTPAQGFLPAPCLGEHTEYVCTEILGMSDEYFLELMQEGVFE